MWQAGGMTERSAGSDDPSQPTRPARTWSFERGPALDRLARGTFDVLVIGGGMTGTGVALDAASRGLRVALVEKDDFASGTSSKSSKMAHGGLRYLQQREFRLVYENLAERQRLLDNAPHLITPLPFLIPLFGHEGVVSKTVARSYSWALWLYDLTGGYRIGKRHRRIGRHEALEHLPSLHTDRLVAGFLYYDARGDDARVALTLARTAALSFGAVAANYAPVDGFLHDEAGRVIGARVAPRRMGDEPDRDPIDVRANVVVNATGVWADEVRSLDEGDEPASLRPAKGIHITVPRSRLDCDIAAVIPVPKDKRSVFVVPWPEADLVYVGTTDTDYQGSLEDPECTPDDVDYLLDAVNGSTSAALTRADVTGVWAGLRPLLAPRGGRRISARTADLSRRHSVHTSASGVITVTGGKWTTYRKMAEDTVDEVLASWPAFGRRRCVTKNLALLGAPGTTPATTVEHTVDPALLEHLAHRYGTELDAVLALADERPALLEPIVDGLPYIGAEVVYAARAEMALGVEDVLSRRTRALLQDARASARSAEAVAALLGAELGWSSEVAAEQARAFSAGALVELAAAGLPEPHDAPVEGAS